MFPALSVFQGGKQVGKELLPPVTAAHNIHTQTFQSLCRMLRIAAAYTDDCSRIFPATPTDHRPVFLICHRRYRAGVDNISVAAGYKSENLVSLGLQQLFHGLGFILIDLATQGVKTKFHPNNRLCGNFLLLYTINFRLYSPGNVTAFGHFDEKA